VKLHNTLSNKLEEFIPIDNKNIKIYVCGPTVYDRPHIGNARSVVVYDVLYRLLIELYGKNHVTYVRNITDVDDKINARAKELGITIQELTSATYKEFHSDMEYLGCLNPTHEPKATQHIKGMIKIIESLIEKNHAYAVAGHVYFDVTSAKNYGTLSRRTLDEMISGARVEVGENKKHPGDFVLWKPVSQKDDKSSIFESPWGPGRPGWHIECSAMSSHFFGQEFDIHGGGADLIFPHHTNEIAQSCSAFPGSKFAHYWVHNGFLTVDGAKMSKSLGNFLTMNHFMDQNIHGEIVRYWLLSTHYRKPIDFNEKAIYDATETMNYLYRSLENIAVEKTEIPEEFIGYLKDDMNTAGAFSYLHILAKNIYKAQDLEEKTLNANRLKACGNLLGILHYNPKDWFAAEDIDINYINELIEKRKTAKQMKNWALADQIRNELRKLDIEIEDHKDGSTSWRK
jgi:cysteinyl-tRNA synthetase